jgi:hypothetical protein
MKKLHTALSFVCLLVAPPALADVTDPLIEGAKLCTRHLPRYEREYGIPTHLLSAIASTESGRYHDGLRISVPWPWTINAEGKGYYFRSKEEAIFAARKLRAQGIKSMDVGCMQVNLFHHPEAFASLEQAFEPQNNIAYAAGFLRNLYQETRSWKEAAADYHSKTPKLGSGYVNMVYNSWYKIIDKLRAAKLQVPESSVAALRDMKSADVPLKDSSAKFIKIDQQKYIASLPEQTGKKLPQFQPARMNSIKVTSKESSRENGIIIVRPDIKVVDSAPAPVTTRRAAAPEILALAEVQPSAIVSKAPSASSFSPEARIIRVDGEGLVRSTRMRTGGPNFIFND